MDIEKKLEELYAMAVKEKDTAMALELLVRIDEQSQNPIKRSGLQGLGNQLYASTPADRSRLLAISKRIVEIANQS